MILIFPPPVTEYLNFLNKFEWIFYRKIGLLYRKIIKFADQPFGKLGNQCRLAELPTTYKAFFKISAHYWYAGLQSMAPHTSTFRKNRSLTFIAYIKFICTEWLIVNYMPLIIKFKHSCILVYTFVVVVLHNISLYILWDYLEVWLPKDYYFLALSR